MASINTSKGMNVFANNLKRVVTNSHKMALNAAEDVFQQPAALKNNALIFSTLFLVAARIGIVFHTAHAARGTDQADLRFREAVRTTIREAGGWFFSYFVLRAAQFATRLGIENLFGLKTVKDPVGLGKAAGVFGKLLSNKPLTQADFARTSLDTIETGAKLVLNDTDSQLVKFMRKRLGMAENAKVISKALKDLHGGAPIFVGSALAILLSGFVLEWFSLNKADMVTEKLTGLFKKRGSSGLANNAPLSAEMSKIPALSLAETNPAHQSAPPKTVFTPAAVSLNSEPAQASFAQAYATVPNMPVSNNVFAPNMTNMTFSQPQQPTPASFVQPNVMPVQSAWGYGR